MRIILLLALLFTGWPALAADKSGDASDVFLDAYVASQKGGQLAAQGDLEGAKKSYQHAAGLLAEVRHRFPTWQPEIVSYREKLVAKALQNPAAASVPAASPPGTPLPTPSVVFKMEAKKPLPETISGAIGSLLFTGLFVLAIRSHYRKLTVLPEWKYSTFAPRFWTGLVDFLVLWPISTAASFSVGWHLPPLVATSVAAINQLAWLVYSIVMHGRCGQTVGKMVTKVKVVDVRTEGPISWGQAFLRDAVPLVVMSALLIWQFVALLMARDPQAVLLGADGQSPTRFFVVLALLPGVWLVAELLTMFTNKKRRSLHDFIAGTVVVRTNVAERVGWV